MDKFKTSHESTIINTNQGNNMRILTERQILDEMPHDRDEKLDYLLKLAEEIFSDSQEIVAMFDSFLKNQSSTVLFP